MATRTIELPELHEEPSVGSGGGGWKVTVFNNDHNTYEEVVNVLMDATGCDLDEAYIETWEVDHYGKSDVHFARQGECERIAQIIAKIGIEVEVRQED